MNMKRLIIATLIVGIGTFIGTFVMSTAAADSGNQERAVVEFTQKVKLMDVILKGKYLIVHDDEKKAQGDACLYVYRFRNGQPDELIVAFHCERVERKPAEKFTIQVSRLSQLFDLDEIQEIQFAGSTAGHKIPSDVSAHAGHH
jgi:hypothetical protein